MDFIRETAGGQTLVLKIKRGQMSISLTIVILCTPWLRQKQTSQSRPPGNRILPSLTVVNKPSRMQSATQVCTGGLRDVHGILARAVVTCLGLRAGAGRAPPPCRVVAVEVSQKYQSGPREGIRQSRASDASRNDVWVRDRSAHNRLY